MRYKQLVAGVFVIRFAKKMWDSTAFPKFRLAQLLQITFTIGFLVDILKRIVGFITSLQLWGHQL